MSTKTSFKRIALVAASALAIAGFSAVPAHAAAANNYITPTLGTALGDAGTATTVSGVTGGTVKFKFSGATADTTYYLTTDSASSILAVADTGGNTNAFTNGTNFSGGVKLITDGSPADDNAEFNTVTLTGAVAGTSVATISTFSAINGSSTKVASITVTWGAAPAYTSAKAYTIETSTPSGEVTASQTAPLVLNSTSGTVRAQTTVTFKDQLGSAYAPASVTVMVTGPGTIKVGNAYGSTALQNAEARVYSSGTGGVDSQLDIRLSGDNTPGAGTITVYVGSAVVATVPYTFYSTTVAKLVATQGASVVSVGATASATQYAIQVKATDASGTAIRSVTGLVGALANSTAVVSAWNCVADDDDSTSLTYNPGVYDCNPTSIVSGKTGKISAAIATGVSSTSIVSNAVDVTVGTGKISTISMAFDKASYAPGEKMLLTVTAKDSTGAAVADDGTYTGLLTLSGNLASPSIGATAVDGAFGILGGTTGAVAGTQVISIYAPATTGTFDVTAKLGATGITAALIATKITASAAIETADNGTASLALDAANAATDAANNAYDEAQNATQAASDALAAVTALAAQVKSLIASVKKLAAAVAKLPKK